jgi:hypothetical protein
MGLPSESGEAWYGCMTLRLGSALTYTEKVIWKPYQPEGLGDPLVDV